MTIQLPQSANLPIERLSTIFSDTTNSYKYYWFLSILEELEYTQSGEMPLNQINRRMISNVWYPLNYYKLSFGKLDSFKKVSNYISEVCEVDNSVNAKDIFDQLKSLSVEETSVLNALIKNLLRWVPYRFLRPFFWEETYSLLDSRVNGVIKSLANKYAKTDPLKGPYFFSQDLIIMNDVWRRYFIQHSSILRSFIFWHLCRYVQKNNPNVIGISEKLFKPRQRDLQKNIDCWKTYLKIKKDFRCIYSNHILDEEVSLDHFMPWSYVVNDLNWNLVPTFKSINSKKSDFLPDLSIYLDRFMLAQYDFFMTISPIGKHKEIIEQYCILFRTEVEKIRALSLDEFSQKLKNIILPLHQNAANIGFRQNWIYAL